MAELKEKCGIFGIYGEGLDVSRLTFYGLFALQHRGQESSGIAAADGHTVRCYKNMGLVTQVYKEQTIKSLKGFAAIGHNRYSTSEGTGLQHAQPVIYRDGRLALAHNGNLPSVAALTEFLREKGRPIQGLSDSELMAEAVGYYLDQGLNLKEAASAAYPLFTGAFCLLMLDKNELVVLRDSCGIRPLALGKINGHYVIASETCAFHVVGGEFVREIKPGEMVSLSRRGLETSQIAPANQKLDIFEFVYFARPDSVLLGRSVYEVRRNFGRRLAKEYPVAADIIVPVPETAIPVAVGYSAGTGLPMEMALVKNRYIHRTFIEPEQHSRDLGVKLKLTPLPGVLRNKRVVVIDDSIVRGTTSRQIVSAFFEAGAREVHFLVSSPPVRYPDFYGIDTPRQRDLIASRMTIPQIQEFLKATSLYYLSLEGLLEATGLPESVFSTSCFTGRYPIDLRERVRDLQPAIAGS